jgi:hypothetical protein
MKGGVVKFKHKFIVLIILSILAGAAYYLYNFSYSTGIRSGKLVKISKKGFALQTYEGTLDLGSGDKLTWMFSVRDDELGEKLIALSGNKVSLHYKEHLFKMFYNTVYNVYDYELVTNKVHNKDLLCRFVARIKQYPRIVDKLREDLIKSDPAVLDAIRACK